jgi:apolipoprotein N-acyltransferase
LIAVSWIGLSGLRENADSFLILGGFFTILFHTWFFLIPITIFYFSSRYLKLKKYPNLYLIFFPVIWTGYEYFHSLGELSFPWLTAGNAFTTNLNKIQFIEFTGVYGISFWICTISVLLFYFLKNFRESCDLKGCGFRSKKNVLTYLAILILFLLPNIYSELMNSKSDYTGLKSEERINIGVVQPNINPWKKWGAKQMELTHDYANMIRELARGNPNLEMIVLPETAVPYYLLYEYNNNKFLIFKNLCDSIDIPILIGTPGMIIYNDSIKAPPDAKKFKESGQIYDTFNSAILLKKDGDKKSYQWYSKIKLVAGSERMPYQQHLTFLKDLIRWGVGISAFQVGRDTTIFTLENKYKFNTAICYESIYPEFFASFVNKGAEFSVIITNDGWWGKLFGTYQHNQYAVLRAIENRRWIIRCANTGISSIIDPYGNMYNKTEINEEKLFVDEIGIRKEKTFYTTHGDIFARSCMYIGLVIFIAAVGFKISVKIKHVK